MAAKQTEASQVCADARTTHSLADLLDCPPDTEKMLSGAIRSFDFKEGEVVFRQSGNCKGLYVIVSGRFTRKTSCKDLEMTLNQAGTGELVELAAVLGGRSHNYTLSAQTKGSALLLPLEALDNAFQKYPPMRIHLLEQLAREVSHAYRACTVDRAVKTRRRHAQAALA
jgi:CRP-like cAMP-binding protein